MSTEVHGAPGAPESDSGEGRRGSRIERLRAALSLPTLRRATGLLDGRHKSVFVGRGQDFDDMSFYRPGDDISDIDWKSPEIALPAFLTIIMMPFSYSITNGIGAGFVSYLVIEVAQGRARKIHPLMWVACAMFVVYFTLAPIKAILGVS